jgi:hypothetical protein
MRAHTREPAVSTSSLPARVSSARPPVPDAHGLQRALGNRAAQQLEVGVESEEAIDRARGAGAPLAPDLRARMEEGLGADLSGARLHTGAGAEQLARSVEARAFTVGSDVFFGAGQFDPSSRPGRELIAHELVHVVQQAGAASSGPLLVDDADSAAEQEARTAAQSVTHDPDFDGGNAS